MFMHIFELIPIAVVARIQRCDNLRICSLNVVAMLERILRRQAMYL
jgi:hypothetical protein